MYYFLLGTMAEVFTALMTTSLNYNGTVSICTRLLDLKLQKKKKKLI